MRIPDTGQTKCYDIDGTEITCPSPGQALYGQDANYTINPMSYTKLDGSGNALPNSSSTWVMVKDNVTGLIWEMKTNKDGVKNYNDPHDADNTYSWYDSNPATNGGNAGTPGIGTDTEDFIKALNDSHYGGYSDWRMPTFKELQSLVDYSKSNPAIDNTSFPKMVSSFYWSSTTFAHYTGSAWGVYFDNGDSDNPGKDFFGYVCAVRGGQTESLGDFASGSFDSVSSGSMVDASSVAGSYTDNDGDGTVTDNSSGLMWQKDTSYDTETMDWEQALAYCERLTLGGYKDWRLPTIKELQSLVDYSKSNPSIDTTSFPNTVSSFYWSSTSDPQEKRSALGVEFYNGSFENNGKIDRIYAVRAVRNYQILAVLPASRNVSQDPGTTTFSVSNNGPDTTINWEASVLPPADSWLSIKSGNKGSTPGTITCTFIANNTASSRTGTVRITATGVTATSQVDGTVTQKPTCSATLDGDLVLHIPYLSFVNPNSGTPSFWVDLVYESSSTHPDLIPFKLTNSGMFNDTSSCAFSTLSSDLIIHIPDVLLQDGSTHLMSVNLQYSTQLSTNGDIFFVYKN
jgi:hypothetical protein